MGAGGFLKDQTLSSGKSLLVQDTKLASAMQALIREVRDSSSTSQDEVSFHRSRLRPFGFPNNAKFEEVVKEWNLPERRLDPSKKFDVLFLRT